MNFNQVMITEEEKEALLSTLHKRFKSNMHRHPNHVWEDVHARIEGRADKLWSLNEMEKTGGEPDLVSFESGSGLTYYDCVAESPKGRRSLCYDAKALASRKENKPAGSVLEMVQEMGVELLTEEEYRKLQEVVVMDLKTSSWVLTPPEIRKLGGAVFCDRRYGVTFLYHNGAESYYASRGFRCFLDI